MGKQPLFLQVKAAAKAGNPAQSNKNRKRKNPDSEKEKAPASLTVEKTREPVPNAAVSRPTEPGANAVIVIPDQTEGRAASGSGPSNMWAAPDIKEWEASMKLPAELLKPGAVNNAVIRDLKNLAAASLRTACLAHGFANLSSIYTNTHTALEAAQKEKKMLGDANQKLLEDARKQAEEIKRLTGLNNALTEDLAKARSEKETAAAAELKAQEEKKAALDRVTVLEGDLKSAEERLNQFCERLTEASHQSFENAIEQVLFLNPNLEIDVAGANFEFWIEGNELRKPPPSPTQTAAEATPPE